MSSINTLKLKDFGDIRITKDRIKSFLETEDDNALFDHFETPSSIQHTCEKGENRIVDIENHI